MTVAGPVPQPRSHLHTMKRRATGLLLLVTVVFVACVLAQRAYDTGGWVQYVQAFAEAAMVGALADWFAVTALFRHPLGLRIPHTAIIAQRKNEIGASLGAFVQSNFVDADTVAERVAAAHPARRLVEWLDRADHRARVVGELSRTLVGVSNVVDDEEVSALIEQAVIDRVQRIDVAPLAARLLEVSLADGRDAQVIDAGLATVVSLLDTNRQALRLSFAVHSPRWLPGVLDERVFERIYGGVLDLLGEVRHNPTHELRTSLGHQLHALVTRLRTDPSMAVTLDTLKRDVLDHPSVREWTSSLWFDAKHGLAQQAADPHSALHQRLDQATARATKSLRSDEALQSKLDAWLVGAVRHVAVEHGHEIASLIRTTVERWDADDTSKRIEAQIGPDLQFIRINGTLVGGLAGLVIYTVARLVGG